MLTSLASIRYQPIYTFNTQIKILKLEEVKKTPRVAEPKLPELLVTMPLSCSDYTEDGGEAVRERPKPQYATSKASHCA